MRAIRWLVCCCAALLAGCGGGGGAPGSGGGTNTPTVALTAPAAFASNLTGMVQLRANASGPAGVASVEFQVDGIAAGSKTTVPYEVSIDTTRFAAGQHIVRARARDALGNLSAWSGATVRFGIAAAPDGFVRDENFIDGLTLATAFAQAPDGRLFIAEQNGTVRIFKNGNLLATPFLQLLNVDSLGERGLIGIALDPNFAANKFVYLHYTANDNGIHNRVSRFTDVGDVGSVGSEAVLVNLPALSDATNHNGGAIHFGIDGKLYVGVGENADPARAQNLSDPLGKLLRFNSDGTIPSDNPFFSTQSGLARAIWASGLRNPFTFAVQPGSGRIHINDVGQNTWEEINLGVAGANYGWPASEGPDGVTAGITAPLFAYNHAPNPPGSGPGGFFTGCSIAGGAFYPAAGNFPAAYQGDYFFADFCSGVIGRLDLDNDNAAYVFGSLSSSGSPVDVLAANDGSLYVLTRDEVVRFSVP